MEGHGATSSSEVGSDADALETLRSATDSDITQKAYLDMVERHLFSAVIADALDEIGMRAQSTDGQLAPISARRTVVGRAVTALAEAVKETPPEPYSILLQIIDSLGSDDLLVVDMGGRLTSGIFGGLLSEAVRKSDARGVIIDGGVRDRLELETLDFAVFAVGTSPADSLGRDEVTQSRVRVRLQSAWVECGDLVVADPDGVVVVPARVEEDVIRRAVAKLRTERKLRRALRMGRTVSDAFEEYGVL